MSLHCLVPRIIFQVVPRRGGGFLGQRAERLETGGGNRGGVGVVGYTPKWWFIDGNNSQNNPIIQVEERNTLPETNSLNLAPENMDGLEEYIFPYWGRVTFQGRTVKLQVGSWVGLDVFFILNDVFEWDAFFFWGGGGMKVDANMLVWRVVGWLLRGY